MVALPLGYERASIASKLVWGADAITTAYDRLLHETVVDHCTIYVQFSTVINIEQVDFASC